MNIKLNLSRISNSNNNKKEINLKLDEGITLQKLLEVIKINKNLSNVFIVNGLIKRKDYHIRDGDEIYIIPLFSGG